MQEQNIDLKEWEQAEIERSTVEAALLKGVDLRADELNVARYLAPPADTCFALEYAFHLLGDVQGKMVVDLGCGSGENTILLARRGAQVCAVDISANLVALARQRMKINGVTEGVRFFVGSAYDLPFADESVDVVFGAAILHHLDLSLTAREVRRVLRPGGRAIFLEPVRNSKVVRFVRSLIPYQAPDISPFERPLTKHEMDGFADGFREYHSKAFTLPYLCLGDLIPKVRDHLNTLRRWDHALLNYIPTLSYFASTLVVDLFK